MFTVLVAILFAQNFLVQAQQPGNNTLSNPLYAKAPAENTASVSDNSGSYSLSNSIAEKCDDVAVVNQSTLSSYTNSSNNQFSLKTLNGNCVVWIVDLYGRVVSKRPLFGLSADSLRSGTYMLEILNEQFQVITKQQFIVP